METKEAPETITTTEPPPEVVPTIEETPAPPLSIFADIQQKTEQDFEPKNEIENFTDNLLSDDFLKEEEEDESIEVKKSTNHITSVLIVSLANIIIAIICKFIAKDWSDKADNRYKVPEQRQKPLIKAIFQMLMLKRKKTNPVWALIGGLLLCYIPLIILAISDRKKNNSDKNDFSFLDKKETETTETNKPSSFEPLTFTEKVESRGRHKKECEIGRAHV